MTDQTDFTSLYRELGIDPDCSVDDFRLAYRRRVAELHPDRGIASGEDDLKDLNLRYAAALEFHRHYGRLPGAVPPPFVPRRTVAQELPQSAGDPFVTEAPVARRPSRVVVYGMLLLAILLVWWWSSPDTESPGSGNAAVVDRTRETAAATAMRLLPGMSPGEVLALHGEPIDQGYDGTQWMYGPSWIRFRCARVVDWYSSPLQPLKASGSRPDNAELARLQSFDERRCPAMPQRQSRQWPSSP